MAKPKAQTLQQRFGFLDKDLTTPKHDEMIVWLRENCINIVGQLFYEPEWRQDVVNELKAKAQARAEESIIKLKKEIEGLKEKIENSSARFYEDDLSKKEKELSLYKRVLGDPPPKPDLESSIERIILENPIVSYGYKSEYIIGFADLLCSYKDWVLHEGYNAWAIEKMRYEIKDSGNRYIKSTYNVYFEAKTKIPSMGELIRQIQMYRQYTHGEWVIISPDDRFADMFKDQGLYFYKYPY